MKHSKAKNIADRYTEAYPAPTISLSEAIKRTTNWRNLVLNLLGSTVQKTANKSDPQPLLNQQIFRAINIQMDDIDWLRAQHPDAKAIRLYLSLPDANHPYQITGMLVPVDGQNTDLLTDVSDENMSTEDIMNSLDDSTIYDFTQPCPSVCNVSSPLFSDTNSVLPYCKPKR